MLRSPCGAAARHGFTLVELMLVVVIVAILAMVAVPMLTEHIKRARMSEGIAGVGMIRTAFRVYSAANSGAYLPLTSVDGTGLTGIAVTATDLQGKYFSAASYSITSTDNTYTIRATLPEDGAYWYEVDQEGNVQKNNF